MFLRAAVWFMFLGSRCTAIYNITLWNHLTVSLLFWRVMTKKCTVHCGDCAHDLRFFVFFLWFGSSRFYQCHDDVINLKRNLSVTAPFVGNSPVNSPYKCQWRGVWCLFWSAPERTAEQQSIHRWIETPSRSLWRHCNGPSWLLLWNWSSHTNASIVRLPHSQVGKPEEHGYGEWML